MDSEVEIGHPDLDKRRRGRREFTFTPTANRQASHFDQLFSAADTDGAPLSEANSAGLLAAATASILAPEGERGGAQPRSASEEEVAPAKRSSSDSQSSGSEVWDPYAPFTAS